jgi:L-threonylcarbamoyladenylate synthase
MKTLRLTVDPENLKSESSREAIDTAAHILRDGGLVAFPTETVYGLGANALNAAAVEKIFLAKERPAWDPLIVHLADRSQLNTVASEAALTASAIKLMKDFWPGPLTLLLPKGTAVPSIVTAGRALVGVRVPAHPAAHALLKAAKIPVAAPSANRFGRISPTLAAHVLEDLDGRIDAVLAAGETTHGLESTVVDASQEPVVLYRPGIVSLETIRQLCGSVVQWRPAKSSEDETTPPESMPSPGIGVRHYAPRARLVLIGGEGAEQAQAFASAIESAARQDGRTGIMLPANLLPPELANSLRNHQLYNWGNWHDAEELAHRLFAGLRHLDGAGVEVILCPVPPPAGLGAAILDRLLKAAKE